MVIPVPQSSQMESLGFPSYPLPIEQAGQAWASILGFELAEQPVFCMTQKSVLESCV